MAATKHFSQMQQGSGTYELTTTGQRHIRTHNDCDTVHKSKVDSNSGVKGKDLMTSQP